MEREVRFRRNQENIRVTDHATTRTQFFEHEVAPVDQSGLVSGSATAKAFASFFNLSAQGAALMGQMDAKREQAEITYRKNPEQQAQGVLDATNGVEADQSLKGDLDYMSAYTITKGKAGSVRLQQDWDAHLNKLPIGANYDEELQSFLKKEVGQGVGDPLYDATLLSGFKRYSDAKRDLWVQNQIKQVDLKDQQDLATVIGNRTQTADLSPETFEQDVKIAQKTFFRHNPTAAAPWVLTQIMGAATSNNAQAVDSFLRQGGYDKQFPQAYAEMTEKLAGKFTGGLTAQGAEYWGNIDRDLADEKVLHSPDGMRELGNRILFGKSNFTNDARFTAAYSRWQGLNAQIVKETAGFNNYANHMLNPGASYMVDPAAVNKYQLPFLQSRGIDPLASPEGAAAAASFVSMNRMVGSTLGTNMKQALMDPTNQSAQTNSYMFWRGLEASGKVDIKAELGQEAYDQYTLIKGLSGGDNSKIGSALQRLINDPSLRELPSSPEKFKWNEYYDEPTKKPSEIYVKAKEDLKTSLAKSLGDTTWYGRGKGGDLVMTGAVEDSLMADFGRQLAINKQAQLPNAKERAMADVLKDVGSKYMLIPRGDGKFVIGENEVPKGGIVPTQQHLGMFKEDVKTLNGLLPGLFGDTTTIGLSIDRTNHGLPGRTRQDGSFNLMSGNDPVLLAPGQKLAKGTEILTLPKDPQEALKTINSTLPKGVEAVPWTVNGSTVFKLSYKFRDFSKTVSELEQEYAKGKDARVKTQLETLREYEKFHEGDQFNEFRIF